MEKKGFSRGLSLLKTDLKEGNLKNLLVFMGIFALIMPLMFLGCSDGSDGSAGAPGAPGEDGTDATPSVLVESCVICHNGITRRDGETHQELYDELYQDNVVLVTNITYAFDNVANTDNVTFNMTKDGLPFDCTEANPTSAEVAAGADPDTLAISWAQFTPADNSFLTTALGTFPSLKGPLTYNDVTNLCTSIHPSVDNVDLSTLNGLFAVYGRFGSLNSDQESPELRFTRVAANKFPFAGVLETATFTPAPYVSVANNDGCQKCHTIPFLKHGYIYGQVDGDPATDFYVCKTCHLDDAAGGHKDWQLVVDDPPLWASVRQGTPLTPAQEIQYAYVKSLMNDVHMSHVMEFPYPQRASNCVTCHEGKLDLVLTDANFIGETCLSCHPVTGAAPGTEPELFYEKTAPALATMMEAASFNHSGSVDSAYVKTTTCNVSVCHAAGGGAPVFSALHTGFGTTIFAAPDQKYSDVFVVTVDNASFVDNTSQLTIGFSATGGPVNGLTATDIAPTVLVGLYGWDSKDYYIGPHERDFDDNGDGVVSRDDERNLEYEVGTTHPRFTTVSSGSGSWVVTADLSAWDNIIGPLNTVRQVEIGVLPELVNPALPAGDNVVALNAPSRTFSLVTDAFIANYYSGTNEIVRVDTGCNNCHLALADSFHSPDRGGNIVVCRLCHITKDAGSHLEMQSRSIDSYAHGIHSFQPFDINNIDFTDPVQALHYEDHIRFAFPTLGRENCESCHNPGKFNVPNQAQSLPGLLSASEFPVIFDNLEPEFPDGQRNVQQVPSYITGPATRACGGCHRVNWINEDDAVELSSFYGHTETNGYLVETESATHNVDVTKVINEVEAMFYPAP
ncbi:MAG: hypothetical protein WBB46_08030 [Candidatus Deferrimicrobiaceae bacterium]